MPPAIVIPAYNRPAALKRLLNSLQVADYSEPSVPLIISVDPESIGPNQVVLKVAESFEWKHGPKRIQVHAKHLGLLQNFYFCGNLTTEYESVIILEDDLWVSPSFYKYATQALSYYEDDASLGGLSLYCYRHNGFTHESFIPLVDGTDIFFAQIGSILGQVWSRNQWENFASWRSASSSSSSSVSPPDYRIICQSELSSLHPVRSGVRGSRATIYLLAETVKASDVMLDALSQSLDRQNQAYSRGSVWTTDAPYRETLEEVRAYQAEGVKTVEMEIAGLYALGKYRNIKVVSAVAVGDSLANLNWQLPDDLRVISRSLRIIYDAAIEVLSR